MLGLAQAAYGRREYSRSRPPSLTRQPTAPRVAISASIPFGGLRPRPRYGLALLNRETGAPPGCGTPPVHRATFRFAV